MDFATKRATFEFDAAKGDLEAMRRAVLEEGFGFDLAEPARVECQAGEIQIEATSKDSRNAVGDDGEILVSLRPQDGATRAGAIVDIHVPENVESGRSHVGKEFLGDHVFPYKVAKAARARFLVFRVEVTAAGAEPVTLRVPVQLDR